jgi:hypothetical protein
MNTKHLAFGALIALALVSCKKDDELPPTSTPSTPGTTGTVKMSFEFVNGQQAFDMSANYVDGANHQVRFSAIKFYVSDIHLEDMGGSTVGDFHDTYLLVDASAPSNEFTLGSVPEGHIHMAHFALGLESAVNHADPTVAEFPLNVPDMHWSWNPTAGYKFLLIEGKVDGNGDGDFDDPEDKNVTYHCATDPMFRQDELMAMLDVSVGSTVTIPAKVDVGTLISGLDLLADSIAMGGGAPNAAAMDGLVSAIALTGSGGSGGTGTVKLSFDFVNGTDAFDMNATYVDGSGNNVRFSGIKFYASEISLTDMGVTTVASFNSTYLLVDAAASMNEFTLGSVPAGHVHMANFALGLENTVNHADPTLAEYPLNVPDMHWSWNPAAGYKFLLIECKVDGNNDGDFDDAEDVDVTYHCATDPMYREDQVMAMLDVTAGSIVTIPAKVDVGALLTGLDLLANPVAMGGGANNATAMDNLVNAVSPL